MKHNSRRADGPRLKLVREKRGNCSYEYYPLGRYVVIAPGICGGRPTFKGTRVEVEVLLDCLRKGRNIEEILESYPSVSRVALQKSITLASKALESQYTLLAA